MRSLHYAAQDAADLLRDPKVVVAIAAILVIPLLYGALYLWAFWDPYGHVDAIPVALVNEDRAVRHDGDTLSAGKDLADELLESRTLGFRLASAKDAAAGVRSGRYYLSLTIPRDFSANLATADEAHPTRAKLDVAAHESANMIASQIGDRVFAEVRTAASESASRSYLDHIFLGFRDVHSSLKEASLGAKSLADGLVDARSGSRDLADGLASAEDGGHALATGTRKVAAGAKQLQVGAARASSGAGSLAAGLATGRSGAAQLHSGTEQVAGGARELATGSHALASGAQQAAESAGALKAGAAQLDAGVAAAVPQLASASGGATQVRDGSAGTVAALEAYVAAHPEVADDPAFAQALDAAKQTAAGAAQLATGLQAAGGSLPALADGAHRLAVGTAQLDDGLATLSSAAAKAASGADAVASGAARTASGAGSLSAGVADAASGATTLARGSRTIASGTRRLASGSAAAAAGSAQLASGLGRLHAGAAQLTSGLAPAVSGSRELADGLTAGLGDVPAYSSAQRAVHADMMSDPVSIAKTRIGAVKNYGNGFAAYFIPLALWIGALMALFVVTPLPARAVRAGEHPLVAALAGYWPLAVIGIVQSVLLLSVLRLGLGLGARNVPALYAFAALASLVFAAVLQWISARFGTPGKLISIVLMMLQLTSAAGTFPRETLPPFFRAVSPYLPMTYVVAGLREAIAGGNWHALGADAARLSVFGIVSLALMCVAAWRARGWDDERLAPKMSL